MMQNPSTLIAYAHHRAQDYQRAAHKARELRAAREGTGQPRRNGAPTLSGLLRTLTSLAGR